jgi:2-methylcitrate dehydratase
MAAVQADDNHSKSYDDIVLSIVDYTYDFDVDQFPESAWTRAKATLLDTLGAAFEGISTSTELQQLLGPTPPSPPIIHGGFKLPGTHYQLDILKGAFDLGASIRYLDHNDAFPGAEWGHPSGKNLIP